MELQLLFSAHCLIMVYTRTKFRKNTLYGFRVMEWTQIVKDRHTITVSQRSTDGWTNKGKQCLPQRGLLGGGKGEHINIRALDLPANA